MIRITTLLLTAALGLIMSALTVHTGYGQAVQTQAAGTIVKPPIPIASLPITITTPGYYYFVSNMYTYPTVANGIGSPPAITVNAPGSVTIDLRGFTLSGPGQAYIGGLYANPAGVTIQSSNVTVKNGTIAGFYFPLSASGQYLAGTQNYISNIILQGITFTGDAVTEDTDVSFAHVNNSIVKDCTFASGLNFGTYIGDSGSQTGNSYINDAFTGAESPIYMSSDAKIIILNITIPTKAPQK
jgi:hypothetical protein